MSDTQEYLTKEKFGELAKELEYLKTDRRKEIAEQLEYTKALGDIAENAEYHEARDAQANLEDRILKLESILKSAVIMSDKRTETASVGSTVTLKREGGSESVRYKIVGSEEADLAQNKLSVHSPIGAAMVGKRKGESFSVKTPGGMAHYKVIEVE